MLYSVEFMVKILEEIGQNPSRYVKIEVLIKTDRYLWCGCHRCGYHLSGTLISTGQIQIYLWMHLWMRLVMGTHETKHSLA